VSAADFLSGTKSKNLLLFSAGDSDNKKEGGTPRDDSQNMVKSKVSNKYAQFIKKRYLQCNLFWAKRYN